MKFEISDDIAYNIINDWKKRNISAEERSYFIKEYLKQNNLSERQLGRMLDIPHSTIHTWVSMKHYNKDENLKRDYETTELKVNKINEIFTLANRLNYLVINKNKIDDKAKKELIILRDTIDKIIRD